MSACKVCHGKGYTEFAIANGEWCYSGGKNDPGTPAMDYIKTPCKACGGLERPEPQEEKQRYRVEFRERKPAVWMVIDERLQMDVYHWHGQFGEEQCRAVAKALNEVNNRHPDTW